MLIHLKALISSPSTSALFTEDDLRRKADEYIASLEVIGEGNGRIVYRDKNAVIKKSANTNGIKQNIREYQVYRRANINDQKKMARVHSLSSDKSTLIMEYARALTPDEFMTHVYPRTSHCTLRNTGQKIWALQKGYGFLKGSSFEKDCVEGSAFVRDFLKPDSWGKAKDGRIVLVDYGS